MIDRCGALLDAADNDRYFKILQMIPLFHLGRPCVTGNSEGRDHKHLVHFQLVEHQGVEGCERDDRLAEAHVQE